MLFFLACAAPPVEAPDDLDGLFHYFFLNYASATDAELSAAALKLAPLVNEATRGTVSDLTEAEQDTLTELVEVGDPAEATGIYITGPVACDWLPFEQIHYDTEQEALYEEASGEEKYIAYDRVYTSDLPAYEARTEPYLSWDTTYTINPVAAEYTAHIDGGMRYVPATEDFDAFVVERNSLPQPATFEAEGSDYFAQDYQLDVLLPTATGSAHAYAVWRDLSSLTLTDESEGVQNLILDGLEEFDRDTETICAGW
jgi:hypothetical protein